MNRQIVIGRDTTVTEVEDFLTSLGINRFHITALTEDGQVRGWYQERAHTPVRGIVPGDVLCAHDLGGTSGLPALINHGPVTEGVPS